MAWQRYNTNPVMSALDRGHSGVIILDGDRREGEIRYGHKAERQLAPGRGLLAYRRHSEYIQIALPENLT
ncbi:type VII secretion protein EccCb [Mycobacteroides abscessus subsp. massiliense]|nr:type VII secretion protein EccCb [Mycobacteroides abscessus subsp. massiliense]